MHERTRKLVSRLAFVFSCALPTILMIVLVLWMQTPWYHDWLVARTEAKLQDWLGMRFHIERLESLAPNAWRLTGVTVLDPETGAEVGKARMVQWAEREGQCGVLLHQPELRSSQLPHGWKLLHDRFLCRPELTQGHVRIAAAELSIHSRSGSATLKDLDIHVEPDEAVARLTASFHLAGNQGTRPTVVSASRNRAGDLPFTEWTLRTGDASLPCSALAEYSEIMRLMGPRAEFLGGLRWSVRDSGWQLDLSGCQFTQVELGQLFRTPWRQMTGLASIELQRCQIVDGRLADLAGRLEVNERGRVGRDLFAAAEKSLGLQLHDEQLRGQDIWFDYLLLNFQLQEQDLRFGALLMDSNHQIASKPLDAPTIPAVNLAGLMAPDYAISLPVSAQTMGLLDLLPLPHVPVNRMTPKPPRVTLRQESGSTDSGATR